MVADAALEFVWVKPHQRDVLLESYRNTGKLVSKPGQAFNKMVARWIYFLLAVKRCSRCITESLTV